MVRIPDAEIKRMAGVYSRKFCWSFEFAYDIANTVRNNIESKCQNSKGFSLTFPIPAHETQGGIPRT